MSWTSWKRNAWLPAIGMALAAAVAIPRGVSATEAPAEPIVVETTGRRMAMAS